MKSLMLNKVVALEGFREFLYNIKKTEKVGDISIIPNGMYHPISRNYITSDAFSKPNYKDGVILKVGGNEYPVFFGAECIYDNPLYLTYGKKEENRLILLQDYFFTPDLYMDNPNLGCCVFIDGVLSKTNGKYRINQEEKLVYNIFEDEEYGNLDIIKEPDLNKILCCINHVTDLFAYKKNR